MSARYLAGGREVELIVGAERAGLPIMLTGPTGCGKTTLVEQIAEELGRPLITVTCHDDLTTADLVGRHLVSGGDVVWVDGPLTRAMRQGAVCYLDEVIEARRDTLAALHSVADHRRTLYLERADETVGAHPEFFLVCSYNPRRLGAFKQLSAPLRQRFLGIELGYLPAEAEAQVVMLQAQVNEAVALGLVAAAEAMRHSDGPGIDEVPSTRLLVNAARMIAAGFEEQQALEIAVLTPLEVGIGARTALRELLHARCQAT